MKRSCSAPTARSSGSLDKHTYECLAIDMAAPIRSGAHDYETIPALYLKVGEAACDRYGAHDGPANVTSEV